MSDFMTGIKRIGPAYPVKPVQPSQKDRKSGKRRKKSYHPHEDANNDVETGAGSDKRKPTIDEHI